MTQIPDDLRIAVLAAASDKDIPAQGFPALRDHLLAGGPSPDPEELERWMSVQARSQELVAELAERLPPATTTEVPAHVVEWWYPILLYPWAEDLCLAVTLGFMHLA